jgi:ferredoxin-NADP reductase
VIFERPPKFVYEPGDWMDIYLADCPEIDYKTFSLASSPTEPDLVITYKQGVSGYKRQLQALRVGDTVRVVQYGNSGFNLNQKYPATLIAGGVGIAPFRSMIKELIDTQSKTDVRLLYQSRTGDFPFDTELDAWAHTQSSLRVHYLDSALKGRAKKDAILTVAPLTDTTVFYIAGPPGMVQNTENLLLGSGVASRNILDDSFTGY